jgi:hypothetical protein
MGGPRWLSELQWRCRINDDVFASVPGFDHAFDDRVVALSKWVIRHPG